ncbi:MAG: 16S rRNA (cytidine(1402)-2'-O)-methyltransferase [Candidatus Omnitrophica bacterium]|nr:16S rRNA (cytidine(1402)-2'-O)-methyltransferase [Candidatus Omnitrophota bacterium]
MPGALYIVSTPIGNLKDITLRAVETLKQVDLIAAEDTRHTKILTGHYGVNTPLTSYFQYNKVKKSDFLIKALKDGKNIALVSDAGTPGISDPGFVVIRKAIREGIKVIPIPGPSAFLTALSASGLPTNKFVFEGFLSNKSSHRRKRLKELSRDQRSIIIYESPHRIISTLGDIRDIMGDICIVCARELTKKFEEIRREKVSACIGHFSNAKVMGEFIIIMNLTDRGT